MTKYSVIVPVFNRLENLKRCLTCLTNQKRAPEYEIIVVDDGSTDGVFGWLQQHAKLNVRYNTGYVINRGAPPTDVGFRYLYGGPNKGFRGGRARNIGAFNCSGDRLVFIDSDVCVNEDLLYHYDVAAQAQPKAVIVGRYDWLPPLAIRPEDEHWLYEAKELGDITDHILASGVDNDSPFGFDQRHADFTDDTAAVRKGAALGALSGNISYDKAAFLSVGGFDEKIIGHGGEDADLGLTVDDELKADWLFYKPLIGFHLWHTRDQKRNAREVQANIQYIDFKHGVGAYANAEKWSDSQDWAVPGHYHKHFGNTRAIKTPDDGTVWIERQGHRMGISSVTWLFKLGFNWSDVVTVSNEEMLKYEEAGATPVETVQVMPR